MGPWRFLFKGEDAADIQGVQFREEIKKKACKLEIKGQVRNLKERPNGFQVEVICETESEEGATKFFEEIKRIQNPLIKLDKASAEMSTKLFNEFKDFNIVREDDLSEMVWALQGAGRVFANQEEERRTVRENQLLESLTYELPTISNCWEYISTERKKRHFNLICIEKILSEPPTGKKELVENIRNLYETCKQFNDMMDEGGWDGILSSENYEKIQGLLKGIKAKCEETGVKKKGESPPQ